VKSHEVRANGERPSNVNQRRQEACAGRVGEAGRHGGVSNKVSNN
jgi:hypothetical protein